MNQDWIEQGADPDDNDRALWELLNAYRHFAERIQQDKSINKYRRYAAKLLLERTDDFLSGGYVESQPVDESEVPF